MNKQTIDLTIGSDPELFILDKEEGRMASALRVLDRRTKSDPIDLGDGMRMYADNVLVETSFPPVSGNGDSEPFVRRLDEALGRMREKLGPRYDLVPQASHTFDSREMQDPIAWEAGCNPNEDVYTEALNLPADFKACGMLRTGSFHIHLGNNAWEREEKGPLLTGETRVAGVKLLDIYLGCSSVLFDTDETQLDRRKLYGKAGEFRRCFYGLEYRCLGGRPLGSEVLVDLVYDLATFAIRKLETDEWRDIIASSNAHFIQEAINTCNQELAKQVLIDAGLPRNLYERVTGSPRIAL